MFSRKYDIYQISISLLLLILLILQIWLQLEPIFVACFSLLVSCSLLISSRNSLVHFISFSFMIAYIIIYIISKYLQIPYHYLLYYQNEEIERVLFFLFSFFLLCIFVQRKDIKAISVPSLKFNNISGPLLIAAIGISLFGVLKAWPPSSEYNINSSSSSLFEYSVIPAVLGIVFSANRQQRLIFVTLVICCFCPLLFGRRGPALMFFWLLLAYLSIWRNFSLKSMITLLVASGLTIRVFALVRAGYELTLFNLLLGGASAMSNHQGGVIVSSNTYLGLVMDGTWDIWTRLEMVLGAIFSWLPYSVNPFPAVYAHIFVRDYAVIPGSGGLPFVYLYIWGGITLLVIGCIFLAYLLTYRSINSRYSYLFYLVAWSTFPRWFAYSLPALIKFTILGLLILILINIIIKGLK